ncbi:hypothetical protein Tco_0452646, partial [Tanacetum coccineum]
MAAYQVPPSPDYIPSPKVPPSTDYIPGPEEPQSPPPLDFVPKSDPEEEPKEDDEDPEEDPADYPADRDDDDAEEEEEEHPAPANFVPPVHCMTTRISIRDEPSISLPPREQIAPTTVEGVNQRVTDLATILKEETTSMYDIMEDAQDDRSQLRGRVNLLYRDRPVHRRLAVMIEREAKMDREAWGLSMDASDYARSDVMSLRTTVVAQSALISELQSADHRRQR